MSGTYPKNGQFGKRELAPGKGVSEQSLMLGETVQLPGGVPTTRKFDKIYVKGDPDSTGAPLPPSSLYDR